MRNPVTHQKIRAIARKALSLCMEILYVCPMIWTYILSAIGLILEMIGVWGIYRIKIKPMRKPYTKIHPFANDETSARLGALIRSLNDNIERMEEETKINDIMARKFFAFIVIGFLFQLSSTIFSVVFYPLKDNSTEKSASKSCEKHSNY